MKFKIPKTPSSTNKSIRFPNDLIERVEDAIRGQDCTFSAFVEEAVRVGARSIAFPAISTGVYGYPKGPAAHVAVAAVRAALAAHEGAIDEVVFCCFSADDLHTLQAALRLG